MTIATPQLVSFEDGYAELMALADTLAEPAVGVDELIGMFRRAQDLEQALRAHLTEREGELLEIERGVGPPKLRVEHPSPDTEPTPGAKP